MLVGRFGDTSGTPYIEGEVSIPALGVRSWGVSFLVDTGASWSLLGPADARNMGIDVAALNLPEEAVHGISGVEHCFTEEAYLVFTDQQAGTNHYYSIRIFISKRDAAEVERLPSALGRDVLNRWAMHYVGHDPSPSLTFEVASDDLSLPAHS